MKSQDPVTGEDITLTIAGEGVFDASPQGAVVSMLEPDGAFDHQVVESFCHYVWFFASPESGAAWTGDHPGTFLLTVEDANTVARRAWPALVRQALDHHPYQREPNR